MIHGNFDVNPRLQAGSSDVNKIYRNIKIALHISTTHEFGKGRYYLIDKKNKVLKELRNSCDSPDIKDIF